MGFATERFKSTPPPEVICSVCSDVFEDPVQRQDCEHSFCRRCILEALKRGNQQCPECGASLTESGLKPVPRLLLTLLSKLEMSCDFKSLGCFQYIAYDQLSDHAKSCPQNPDLEGCECEEKVTRFSRDCHLQHGCQSFQGLRQELRRETEAKKRAQQERLESEVVRQLLNEEIKQRTRNEASFKATIDGLVAEKDALESRLRDVVKEKERLEPALSRQVQVTENIKKLHKKLYGGQIKSLNSAILELEEKYNTSQAEAEKQRALVSTRSQWNKVLEDRAEEQLAENMGLKGRLAEYRNLTGAIKRWAKECGDHLDEGEASEGQPLSKLLCGPNASSGREDHATRSESEMMIDESQAKEAAEDEVIIQIKEEVME